MNTTNEATATETKKYMTSREIKADMTVLPVGAGFKVYSRTGQHYPGVTGIMFETDSHAWHIKMNFVRRYAFKFER